MHGFICLVCRGTNKHELGCSDPKPSTEGLMMLDESSPYPPKPSETEGVDISKKPIRFHADGSATVSVPEGYQLVKPETDRPKEYFGVHLPNKQFLMLLDGPSEVEPTLHLIEKSAYDKLAEHNGMMDRELHTSQELAKRIASERDKLHTLSEERWANLHKREEQINELKQELAELKDNESKMHGALSAKQEIINGLNEDLACALTDLSDARREVEEAKAELKKFVQFDAFLKDDGSVDASVYESAVKGRQDFRNALREERARSQELEAQVAEYKKLVARDGYSAAEYEREKTKELLSALEYYAKPRNGVNTIYQKTAIEAIKRYNSGKGE